MEVCKNLVARAHYCIENHENLEEEETDEDIDDDEEEHHENENKNELNELLKILEINKPKKVELKVIMKAVLRKCDDILNINIQDKEKSEHTTEQTEENKSETENEINKNEPMSFDLRNLSGDAGEGKLEEFLGCRKLSFFVDKEKIEGWNEDEAEEMERITLRKAVSEATHEGDILNVLKKSAPKNIAVKLMQKKYEIRWNTPCGEADDYDFYSLPANFVKGSVRKAYMQTVLWSHRQAIKSMFSCDDNLSDFCPPFLYHKHSPYRKVGEGSESQLPVRLRNEPHYMWKKWSFNNSESTQSAQLESEQLPEELSWISPKVRLLIRKLCEPIEEEFSPDFSENVMYMLVVDDSFCKTVQYAEKGFKSKVYVGSAEDGLKENFFGEEGFCENMLSIKKHFSNAEFFIFHPTALLVELRLLQALISKEKFALFVLNTFEDSRQLTKEVHELVGQALYLNKNELWGPATDVHFGLNLKDEMRIRKKSLPNSFPGKRRKKRKN